MLHLCGIGYMPELQIIKGTNNVRYTPWATALTLWVCLMLTALIGYVVHQVNEQRIQHAVASSASPIFDSVIDKINRYRYGLMETRSAVLAGGGEEIKPQGFHQYGLTLDLARDFPGAGGFGFIRRVPRAGLADYLARERDEHGEHFAITYSGDAQDELYVVEYLEPQNTGMARDAIGFDMASNLFRKRAADEAVIAGDAVITPPLSFGLSLDTVSHSFLLFLPIYQGGRIPPTDTERQAKVFGWSYAFISVNETMMEGLLHEGQEILRLSDVTELGAPVLFYHSTDSQGLYPYQRDVQIMGRVWRFTLSVTPEYLDNLNLLPLSSIMALGGLISILMVILVQMMLLRHSDRKQLREERNKLELIVESSPDGIIGKDINGNIISWNAGAEHLFGYTRQEAVGRPLAELIIPDRLIREEVEILRRVRQGETVTAFETQRHRKDGTEFAVSATISPIRSASGDIVGASKTVRDISLQKEAEKRIRELNSDLERQVRQRTAELEEVNLLFSTVLSAAHESSIIATDLHGVIQLFNNGAERMLGYRAEEVVGKITPAILHDEQEIAQRGHELSEEFGQEISGFPVLIYKASQEQFEHHEWTYIRKDGSRFPVSLTVTTMRDKQGQRVGYLGVAADITQQKQAQESLERARDELLSSTRTLLIASQTAGLGIWRWNLADNSLEWNDKMYELYDWQPLQAQQHSLTFDHWKSRVHPEDVETTVVRLMAAVAEKKGHDLAFRIVCDDGSIRFIRGGSHIEEDANGNVVRMTGVNIDVTDDNMLKLRLIEAKEQADAASAAKSMFLANMSHEIRTPMNAVLGMLQLLLKNSLTPKQHDFASKAHIAATSLLSVLNDVLDYSKIEAGKLELEHRPFNLNDLMQHLAIVLSGNLRNNAVELLFDLDEALPPNIIGDELRLQQVLINLVSNAIKFTEKGQVVVKTALLGLDNDRLQVNISVTDSGIGISLEQQKRIFDGFTQAEASTSRRYGGTGLGLVISRRLVEQMGGSLEVTSQPGQGSTFFFSLSFPRDTATYWEPLHFAGPPPRVLVVDDNSVARALFVGMLRAMQADVESADGAEQAISMLAHASAQGQAFDVVVLDWLMPTMDGVALAHYIRQRMTLSPAPFIVLISAASHEDLPDTHEDSLLDQVISKPVTPQQLLQAISPFSDGKQRDSAPDVPASGDASLPALSGLSLLLVEDNPFNQTVAFELLVSEGAEVVIASGGEEGVDCVMDPARHFDAVLMDLQMPDIDGFEATRRIRANPALASLPIIAMTANVSPADKQACLAAGMNGHLGKPLDFSAVVKMLLQVTGRQAAAPQTPSLPKDDPLAQVLVRFGGNRELYTRLLQAFMPSFDQLLMTMRQQYAALDWLGVMATLHTLKGTSGSVGLEQLYQRIVAVEASLKQAGESNKAALLEPLLATMEDQARQEYDAIRACLAVTDAAVAVNDSHTDASPEVSNAEIVPLIAELSELLGSGNLRAMAVSGRLADALVAHKTLRPLLTQLVQAVENMEFDEASRVLALIQDHGDVESLA
ncbi:PAS domain S-box protein [Dickeya undicola]|uniref:Sensory/regulatory protein RpfC n=2 Tax=Dickeya undicola TaxID=1577887 RepID=A0A3N0G2G2_9GAMM|nr:PAS domain S-box protein [Dickeya undicola]